MNMNSAKRVMIIAFAVLLVICSEPPKVTGQGVTVRMGEAHMNIVTDEIVGVALYPDGITPIQDLPVRVWDVDNQKMIFRTRTDEDGMFNIPRIDAGRCFIFVGRVKVDLRILQADVNTIHQHHDIVVIVPRGLTVSLRPHVMDVVLGALLLPPPEEPKTVSP